MQNESDLLGTLRRLPLFIDLSDEELAAIAKDVTRRRYKRGEAIFSEGDPCNELLIVEEGSVRILKSAPSGRSQLIAIERRGSSLAEAPVFDGGTYHATAEAVEGVVLLSLPADDFRKICVETPDLALKMFKILGYRLRHLARLVEELSFSTVRGRLIAHLLQLAQSAGRETEFGIQFELRENNEELAARLGTVRELVSRNLGLLHGAGLIEMNRRTVNIRDLAALRSETASTE
jgi:CRP/FNR family transcriptional regulator, cyclic AMP receptor protein